MPCCDGIWSIGIGDVEQHLGITSGTMPNTAYLARISATRASIGIAGNGMPLKSIKSITAVRSSPVTDSVVARRRLPGVTSCCVTTPSISTCGVPLMVTTMTTRRIGGSGAAGEQEERVQRRVAC